MYIYSKISKIDKLWGSSYGHLMVMLWFGS